MSDSETRTQPLLPPRFIRANRPERNGDETPKAPAEPLFTAGLEWATTDGLLPPRRHSQRFNVASADRNVGPDAAFVLLPDATGGFRKVSNQMVHSRTGTGSVPLRARTRGQALRYRIFVNLVAIGIGLAILFGVFWLAINGYI